MTTRRRATRRASYISALSMRGIWIVAALVIAASFLAGVGVARWRATAAQDERARQQREAETLAAAGSPCSECGRPVEPDSPAAPTLCRACAYLPF